VQRGEDRDTYLERIAKYIPGEIVAAYVFLLGVTAPAAPTHRFWIVLGITLFCLVLTPLYLGRVARSQEPKALHLTIGTLAFPIWAYAIAGPQGAFIINGVDIYDSIIASVLLVGFSLLTGLFEPVKKE
jgi:hypothetical protein